VFFAGWLAWFGVLPCREPGQFQSWHGDRNLCFALYPLPGIDPRRFLTVKERRGWLLPFAAVCRCDGLNMNQKFTYGQVPKVHIYQKSSRQQKNTAISSGDLPG
jgi:hypothetical protein